MKKIWVILRHEFLSLVLKPAFWVGLLVVPVITGVVILVIALSSGAATAAAVASRNATATAPQGYVDFSNTLKPEFIKTNRTFVRYETESEARVALAAKKIEAFFVVPADYLATGKVTFIGDKFSPLDDDDTTDDFRKAMRLSLLKGDAALAERLPRAPTIVDRVQLKPQDQSAQSPRTLARDFPILPIATCMMFFVVMMSASSYLMRTVSTEKENRVIEVLMSSASPVQILTGKILGFGVLGFIQLVLWLYSALTIIRNPFFAQYVGAVAPATVVWAVVFFVGGYFIYASLMAAIGALMPTAKEAGQYVFFIMLPLLIPVWLNTSIATNPNGILAVALSLLPLTSPVVMPMRLVANAVVPLWQMGLGLALLLLGVLAIVWLSARVFRAQALLSGSKPSLKQLVAAFR